MPTNAHGQYGHTVLLCLRVRRQPGRGCAAADNAAKDTTICYERRSVDEPIGEQQRVYTPCAEEVNALENMRSHALVSRHAGVLLGRFQSLATYWSVLSSAI